MSRSSRSQRGSNDDGYVIVLVLVVAVMLMGILAAALTSSDFSQTLSSQYNDTS